MKAASIAEALHSLHVYGTGFMAEIMRNQNENALLHLAKLKMTLSCTMFQLQILKSLQMDKIDSDGARQMIIHEQLIDELKILITNCEQDLFAQLDKIGQAELDAVLPEKE